MHTRCTILWLVFFFYMIFLNIFPHLFIIYFYNTVIIILLFSRFFSPLILQINNIVQTLQDQIPIFKYNNNPTKRCSMLMSYVQKEAKIKGTKKSKQLYVSTVMYNSVHLTQVLKIIFYIFIFKKKNYLN